jgi:hypothetical protein
MRAMRLKRNGRLSPEDHSVIRFMLRYGKAVRQDPDKLERMARWLSSQGVYFSRLVYQDHLRGFSKD